MRRLIVFILILLGILAIWDGVKYYSPKFKQLVQSSSISQPAGSTQQVKIVTEESVTIDTVKKTGPSVVTIAEMSSSSQSQSLNQGPFSIFGVPGTPPDNSQPLPTQPQSIGSGFIVSSEGLIVTNKHVVADTTGKYQVITANDKKYDVQKIYRDPLNDLAIIKIDSNQNSGNTLNPVGLGDSSHLQVGQFVIAIGTALGEFRNTVTTGVISGLGRGIQAGDQFQGYVEQLDNVIQTSAPINPGNSGGPLLNSAGQVIGINTAVSQQGQNIGFAIPVNTVKDSLNNFNQTGQFTRPFLGVAYKMIAQDVALMNGVPAGAYVQDVVANSPAEKAGIQKGDIIVKINGQRIGNTNNALADTISKNKIGDTMTITIWRNNSTQDVKAILAEAPNQ